MKKRFAIILLRVANATPQEPFNREYAERLFTSAGNGTNNLVDYYRDMSHGQLDLGESQVIGWIDYGHSVQNLVDEWNDAKAERKTALLAQGLSEADAENEAQLHANAHRRGITVTWAREAAGAPALAGFDGIVCVFNTPVDYFGSSAGYVVVNWDPSANHTRFSVDLTGIAHEVGHMLGLNHSYLENSEAEYGDPYDIMSAYGVFYDTSGTNTPPGSPYYTFGPGLSAANMQHMGWLDPTRVLATAASATFKLRPLHRRDLSGWLVAKVQIGYETLYVEFRARDRWDAAIAPCVLLHRTRTEGTSGVVVSELVSTGASPTPLALSQGDSYTAGEEEDPFGFFARLSVTRIDNVALEADIALHIRQRRLIEPSATPYGAVTSDGGGLIWTPGRGFTKVPPRSPLLPVLESLATFEAIQEQHALLSRVGSTAASVSAEVLREAGRGIEAIARAQTQERTPRRVVPSRDT